MSGATDRLSRLLAMVPWLLENPGVELAAAARHFEVSESQLIKDLELLFVCGTPGHLPDDLIDADWESGRIYLRNADAIARPLRLTLDEAVSLLAGLRTLAEVPGITDGDAVQRLLTKLSEATGDAAARASGTLHVDLGGGASEPVLRAVQQALSTGRRLHLTYLVPSRDETTERRVDPIRLLSIDDRWYLEGWCHRAEAVRRFRLDRVVAVRVLDEASAPPPAETVPRRPGERPAAVTGEDLFQPEPEDLRVVFELSPAAWWLAEYFPVEDRTELPDGRLRVTLRSARPDFPARLALRLGESATVVSPDEVVAMVNELATAALAGYR